MINKNKDSLNFDKIISDLSSSQSSASKSIPWYKKKASIIAMSSTLGVGVLATAIAVPVALLSNAPPSAQDVLLSKIATFNSETVSQKRIKFNDLITLAFQTEVYNFWMKDAQQIIDNNALVVNSPLYKYVLNNLDQSVATFDVNQLKIAIIQFMNSFVKKPTTGFFTEDINKIFKTTDTLSGPMFLGYSVALPPPSSGEPAENIAYILHSMLEKNILDLKIAPISNSNELNIVITMKYDVSDAGYFFQYTHRKSTLVTFNYSYKSKYTLNDEYTNNLLTPLITNFLNTKY